MAAIVPPKTKPLATIHGLLGPALETLEANPTTAIPPPPDVHEARKLVLASVGKLTELTHDPSNRVLEVACQYWENRCLFIAAERRIPDLLSEGGASGVPIAKLAQATGIEVLKLERILRGLCSIGIFDEVAESTFANNRISAVLVNNEPLRAYVLLFGLDLYTASDHLPSTLLSAAKGHSYDVDKTAFQDAVGTTKPRWEWLEESVPEEELRTTTSGYPGMPELAVRIPKKTDIDSKPINGVNGINGQHVAGQALHKRPEHGIFGLAMLGGGRVFGEAHVYDYPWQALGQATVADVGGGVGGFMLQLSEHYPQLSFVVQDRAPVLEQAKTEIWPKQNPEALASGRVTFQPHDFFQQNPAVGADVFWLRYILHDWSDSYCIKILAAIKPAMAPTSRILICDQIMNTTLGCPELDSAPWPLPANYGYHTRYAHQRDMAMMGIINGIERTPQQFKTLVERAGLKVSKIYQCRSPVGLVEVVLP